MSANRVSVRDIAEKLGVSASTVSRALRNDPRLTEETRIRVQETADKMGYRRNVLVAELMTQLKMSKRAHYVSNLAWINHHDPKDEATEHALRWVFKGAEAKAAQLGYELDSFYIQEEGMTVGRLQKILKARGIRGVVFSPFGSEESPLWGVGWEDFGCAIVGSTPREPDFHRADGHGYYNMILCLDSLEERGYQQLGMVTTSWNHHNNQGVPVARFKVWEQSKKSRSLPGALILEDLDDGGRGKFLKWLEKKKPEAIVVTNAVVRQWLADEGVKVPEEVALAHVSVSPENKANWSGIDQRQDLMGEAAVDVVTWQLERGECGIPENSRILVVRGRWIDGETTSKAH